MKRTKTAVLLVFVGGIAVGCASAATTPVPPTVNVTGRWTGECFNCAATGFTLVATQDGSEVKGTVIAAGRHAFGDSEKPLLNGRVSGNRFIFQAKGDPGDLCDVELKVATDGKTMEGNGHYRAPFGLRFRRQ